MFVYLIGSHHLCLNDSRYIEGKRVDIFAGNIWY